MLLPTLALALQGFPAQIVVDAHASDTAQGLVHRALVRSGGNARIIGLDATGRLVDIAPLEGQIGGNVIPAVSGTRVVAPDESGTVRAWERGPALWARGPELGLQISLGTFQTPLAAFDVDDERSVVVSRVDGELVVHDLRTAGQATLETTVPIPPPRFVRDVAIDGDVVAFVEGNRDSANGQVVDVRVRLLERGPAGWVDAGALDPPPGVDLTRSVVSSIDAQGGRIAVGATLGPPGDPGGRVFVYDRASTGGYVLDAIVRPDAEDAVTPDRGTGFGLAVHLAGDELSVTTQFNATGQRFERTALGWVPLERVGSDSWPYYFAFGGRLLGNRAGQPHLFEPVDSTGVVEVECSGLVPSSRSFVLVDGLDATASPLRRFTWFASPHGSPDTRFFLVGTAGGRRPLGPSAELCVGAPFGVTPVASSPGTSTAALTLDPTQLGLPAGTTVFVQGWRRESADPGGLTSPAFSVTVPN